MNTPKVDAALSAMMAHLATSAEQPLIEVSVRTHGPLSHGQAAELGALGVEGADTRRTIFPARVSPGTLRVLAAKPWVFCVSLAQALRPLAAGESE